MMDQTKNKYSGFAIAIAWPATFCKQPGSWYDSLAGRLGISVNNYYRAGHAALVLVESKTGECHYFDFGRYHAPYQHGRVRSGGTDPGLAIKVQAVISADGRHIRNFEDIMTGLQYNTEYHGDGTLYASYCKIVFSRAYNKAMKMQADSPLAYGPFAYNGSNCSRFVNTCILAGIPAMKHRLKLKYFVPLTPTPLNNVNSLACKIQIPHLRQEIPLCPQPLNDKRVLKSTLPEPEKPSNIPENAIWHSGEGAGSWFVLDRSGENFLVRRFSPKGTLECEELFSVAKGQPFDPHKPYKLDHISHCKKVRVIQGGKDIELTRVSGRNHNFSLHEANYQGSTV
jgi:hypothetical protein